MLLLYFVKKSATVGGALRIKVAVLPGDRRCLAPRSVAMHKYKSIAGYKPLLKFVMNLRATPMVMG